ncbi:MAG: 2,3-bisphosphoglycerate-independent phosphoglycerate mutase [Pseudomonadota bacterium]
MKKNSVILKPVVLIILDGWGYSEKSEGNAIRLAETPFWDEMWKKYPHTLIKTSGLAVGLPEGTMGNSEVGHLNIGAGRIVYQDFTRINKAIEDGSFYNNENLVDLMKKLKSNGGTLHLMGLCSDIGVHAHIGHLKALLKLAHDHGIDKILVHAFTDGRDSPPDSGFKYIERVQEMVDATDGARIATVMGRYYAMDRDTRWDRTEKAYRAIVSGEGLKFESAIDAVKDSYKREITDEFIEPSVMVEDGMPVSNVKDGDAVIFFNFRPDRARQLTKALALDDFDFFDRGEYHKLLEFICMTKYDPKLPLKTAFGEKILHNIFGEVLSSHNLKQLRIAETEKYAHVTFFFNGGEDKVFPGEERALIPSPREVATYDLKPEMSAFEVTEEFLKRIDSGKYDVIVANFANGDMVGHTGFLEAAKKAVHTVDECLSKIVPEVLKMGGALLITADHGNSEEMFDKKGSAMTAHSINPVPLIYVASGDRRELKDGGGLADIAPTMLGLLGIEKPAEMTGNSLLK